MPVKAKVICQEPSQDQVNPYLLVEGDKYLVTLKDINLLTTSVGESYRWDFVVASKNKKFDGEPAKGIEFPMFSPAKLFPSGDLWVMLEKMYDKTLTPDDTYDINELIGKHFIVIVEHFTKDVTKNNTIYKNTYNRAISIKRYEPPKK